MNSQTSFDNTALLRQEKDELSLKDILTIAKNWIAYLRKKWLIIAIAGLIGAAIGFVYAWQKQPLYKASLSFALEDEKSSGGGLTGALGLASQFGFDLGGGGGAFTGANLIELMKSRVMVEKALLNPCVVQDKQLSMADFYIEFNDLRRKWQKKPELPVVMFPPSQDRSKFTRLQDSVLGVLYDNIIEKSINVDQKDKKVSIININVKSTNEIFSKYFADLLAKEVSEFYIETKSKKARANLAILERQTDSIRGQLNSAISGVAVANDNTYNLNPALNVRHVPSMRRQVDVQANTAILTELVKNLEMARVALRKETPLIQIIDRPILPLKKEELSKSVWLIMGGFFGALLMIVLLLTSRLYQRIK